MGEKEVVQSLEQVTQATHIAVSDYLFDQHAWLFDHQAEDPPEEVRSAAEISQLLLEQGVISEMSEPFQDTTLYFRRGDVETFRAIDTVARGLYPSANEERAARLSYHGIFRQVVVAELGLTGEAIHNYANELRKRFTDDSVVASCVKKVGSGMSTKYIVLDPNQLRYRVRDLLREEMRTHVYVPKGKRDAGKTVDEAPGLIPSVEVTTQVAVEYEGINPNVE